MSCAVSCSESANRIEPAIPDKFELSKSAKTEKQILYSAFSWQLHHSLLHPVPKFQTDPDLQALENGYSYQAIDQYQSAYPKRIQIVNFTIKAFYYLLLRNDKGGFKMPDDLTIRQPHDRNYINTSQSHEVNDWCKKFNVNKETLLKAVKAVGNRVTDVEKYLKG